ncbi:uncharacterized protein LOC126717203 isoform X2 [Quercus robur]|uniref:uncharacterized protein LOC126717203 isoform X2 n=1 Tax=Quercus robur TaxID=38942 RepID=UPI0021631089|nr:uncharacterized protein LOC126717203 isoform X2 [Quercus robur]
MEFLTSAFQVVFEKIVDYTIGAAARQMGYLIHYQKNVDNLRTEVKELEEVRESVQQKVEAAQRNVEEIEAKVRRWLTSAEEITAEVQIFLEDVDQANLKTRYQLGRRADELGLAVKDIKDKGTFQTVGHPVPIQGGTTISTTGYEDFESRKLIFDGVMKALKDDNIRAIGVCGMGGLGKTMLVGKVATQAIEDKLFERIATVVVSQTPNLKQIQKDIAKELELEFKDEYADFRKAHLLRERLKKEKILLIIDDIWNKIDLEDLGISIGDDRRGSKLLLTSRFRDVLDKDMDAEKIFQVEVLLNNEAKFLFVKIVGDFAETMDFQSTMVEVVKECAGLPIAITAVANTLKKQKNPNIWKDALRQLQRANPTQIKGMHDKVYPSIKLSYNSLTKEAKSLFLFCSSFEEDTVVKIDLLWRYLVGLDFFEDVYKMEEVRNRVHTLVNSLKDSCLLEGCGSGTFKMHDVIRDVAIYIADKEKEMLTIRSSDDSEKWSNMRKLKDSIGVALFEAKFSELPERLECPQLNFIILGDKENSSPIPNNFFEGAKELKVLVLMRVSLPLPSSLSFLQNLQTLALLNCESEDMALIGELKNLKALVLVDSKIKQLPMGIRQLTHLQLLDLRRCTKLEAIPSNVLSNLKNIEEIHMNRSFNQWQVDGEITERSNARVSELDHLSQLTTLCIHIPNPKILPKALLFDKLVRYEILIGPEWNWNWDGNFEFEISRTLKIDLDRSFQEEDGIKILLKTCEYLNLAPGKGIKNILYEVDKEGFPRLKHLYVEDSDEIQYIIDSIGQCVAFPVLELLSLVNMINLEKICHNQLAMGSFHNLRKLEMRECDNLIFVFSSSWLKCFSQLQEIEIEDCKVMSTIVAEQRKCGIQVNDDIITDTFDFTQLRSLNLKTLPNLLGFCSNVDSQPLFNKKVAFSNLENLHIEAIYKLKMLWHNQLVPDSFCKLKQLCVEDCENLINIFQPNILRRLQNLEDLQIRNCSLVEEVFEVRGKNVDEICDMVSTQFKVLELINLPKLKHVWSSDPQAILTFQNLHEVKVSKCKSMKSLFPASVAKSLEQLERLEIHDCRLEEIVAMEEGSETVTKFVFPQLVYLSLELMPDLKCFYPGKHTLELPSLKQLTIHKCDKVKIVALNELSFPDIDGLGHDVLTQQPFFLIEKVAFSNLEDLRINDKDNLKMLWYNYQLIPDSFCKLKKLDVASCKNIMHIFPPNMLRRLQNLKELEIMDCNSVEEVFDTRGVNVDEICDSVSIKLKVLRLFDLPKLKHVWSSDLHAILTFPNLHTIEVSNCKSLKSLFPVSVAKSLEQLKWLTIRDCGLEEIVAMEEGLKTATKFVFPQLLSLNLQSLPELKCLYQGKHVWSTDPQPILAFQNLHKVEVSNCKSMKSLFPDSVAKSLEQLESLKIHNCGLEEIVAMEEGSEIVTKFVFPRLLSLILELMPDLKCFYPEKHTLEWPSLKHLTIHECDKVKIVALNEFSFLDTDGLGHHVPAQQPFLLFEKVVFSTLEDIRISAIDNLKMLWHNHQLIPDSFCKLKKLRVDRCKNLMNIFLPNMLRRLQNLEELEIRDCNSVEEVFDIRGINVDEICDTVSTRLRVLRLFNLPKLEHVWSSDPQAILTFQNLCEVEVRNCKSLKSFFPILVAKSREQLESLTIGNCGLEEIVAMEGVETTIKFLFPRITSLYLESLPEFKYFYPGKHTSEWPSLKRLRIYNCNKVKIIASNELSFPERDGLVHHFQVHPLFPIEKDTLSNFEELKLDWDDTINQTFDRLKAQFSCKLKVLGLYSKDRSTAFPWVFVQGLYNLKELDISNFFLEEFCPCGIVNNEGQYAEMFECLTTLHLSKMPKLMHLWKENPQQGRGIQNLESLHVSECGRLKNLVPSSMCFRNLNTMKVSKCHGLISLATSSTAKSLVQLKRLTIYECKRMREIVTSEGEGEAGDENCFNQLKYLSLYDLPTLGSLFHLGNRTMKFPSLEYLYVTRCPELKIFSIGVLSMPKLMSVGLDGNYWSAYQRDLFPVEDVNTFIKRYWEKNNDSCLRQLFTQKTNASTSEVGEENDVDDLEDDSM